MDMATLVRSVLLLVMATQARGYIHEIAKWKYLTYDFPFGGGYDRFYVPEDLLLTGLEITHDRIFVASPNLRLSVPATLSTIPLHMPPGSTPVLRAFPDWSWHQASRGYVNCSTLISVYRIRSDSCGRIWALDSGVQDVVGNQTMVCPPKLVIFDARTSKPVRSVTLPRQLIRTNTLTTNLIIDETTSTTRGGCDDVFVYISDTLEPGLIVYDSKADSAWRVTHPSMYPDPGFTRHTVNKDVFDLEDGIVGMAFSPTMKMLFFQPVATDRIFSISAEVLRRGPVPKGSELPVKLVGMKSSTGLALGLDPFSDTLFYNVFNENVIASWNPHTFEQNVVAQDPSVIEFAPEIRWIRHDPAALWVLMSSFHKYFSNSTNTAEVNMRILRITPDIDRGQLRRYRQTSYPKTPYYHLG